MSQNLFCCYQNLLKHILVLKKLILKPLFTVYRLFLNVSFGVDRSPPPLLEKINISDFFLHPPLKAFRNSDLITWVNHNSVYPGSANYFTKVLRSQNIRQGTNQRNLADCPAKQGRKVMRVTYFRGSQWPWKNYGVIWLNDSLHSLEKVISVG